MRHRAWAVGGVGLAAIVVVLLLVKVGSSEPRPVPPPVLATRSQSSGVMAHGACADVADVQRMVRQDAAAHTVLRYVRVAVTDSSDAAAADPTWRSLQSGITAIQQGFDTDNGAMTTLGIAIVRDQCRRTGLELAHFDALHT